MLFQPVVQCLEVWEDRGDLPQSMARIADFLLNLAFFPTGSRIAELCFKDIVAGHRQEACVHIALLAAPDTINSRLHIAVYATARNAAEHAEGMPMGIEQHLVGLQQIGSHQKRTAM